MDLTKKTKIKGLTTTSWFIIIILGFISWFVMLLYAGFVIVFLYSFLFLLEYLDEDIYDIIFAKIQIPQNKFYA